MSFTIYHIYNVVKRFRESREFSVCIQQGRTLQLNVHDLWPLQRHCISNHHVTVLNMNFDVCDMYHILFMYYVGLLTFAAKQQQTKTHIDTREYYGSKTIFTVWYCIKNHDSKRRKLYIDSDQRCCWVLLV